MKNYKNYTVFLSNGNKIPLLAKNNKEAMKLTGAIAKFNEVARVTDIDGNIIIQLRSDFY